MRGFISTLGLLGLVLAVTGSCGELDPKGEIHMPIGIPNSVDTLKTFVEAEGSFSPGFATYGIYFWIYNCEGKALVAPTMSGVPSGRGLAGAGYLIPWTEWEAGDITVRTEVCQVERDSPAGTIQIVGARVRLTQRGPKTIPAFLYAALRPLGPAGGPVRRLEVSQAKDALLVDHRPALVAEAAAHAAGVSAKDDIGQSACRGQIPDAQVSRSETGDASGALRFELELEANQTQILGFVCPVLPGRRAVGHHWDGSSDWAQFDLAEPNPPEGGALQPNPGLGYYRALKAGTLFEEAHAYWKQLVGRSAIRVPDARWAESFAAIIGHAAMAMNEGAPDVAVVNYNVFNRDGVYVANILQKSGNFSLAKKAIDYFLGHPFNGRTRVEADNPGQILWILGEHWRFTHDRTWLEQVYPSAAKIAAMIRYCRTTPPPHYVKATSLDFGDRLPPDSLGTKPAHQRQILKPGSCDGHHPEYTEAFDIAGLRAAALLAHATGRPTEAAHWSTLAETLLRRYDAQFGQRLAKYYGNYAVLWPCRLYPFPSGKAHDQFKDNGATQPGGWRYFALAKAHQGLLVGNRQAGFSTVANHLAHPQMQGWYLCDEGGKSSSGGWQHARTTWNRGVAMPHGWAVAELWLLLRDCFVLEDDDRLRLLSGIPPEWFKEDTGITVENLPTHFGRCSFRYQPAEQGAMLILSGHTLPPGGFDLALPPSLQARVSLHGTKLPRPENDVWHLPPTAQHITLHFPRNQEIRDASYPPPFPRRK